MGNKNAVSKDYLSDPERFAQIFNNTVFGGTKLICPDRLRELDPEELTFWHSQTKKMKSLEKYRDILRIYDDQALLILLGIENQSDIHYAMPLRQMMYDVLNYERQRAALERKHRKAHDLSGSEFTSGISKKDRLIPVLSLVVYWGDSPWDGPKTLHEMLDIPPNFQQYKSMIGDYRIHLLDVHTMKNLDSYSGELKALLGFVRYQTDQAGLKNFINQNTKLLNHVSPETVRAISILGNSSELCQFLKEEANEEVVDMCQALQEWMMEERMEGHAEGHAEGIAQGTGTAVLALLEELGSVPEHLKSQIQAETNLDTLTSWLKLAAKASSLESFEKQINH